MKMPKIFEGVSRKLAKPMFYVKRVSPEICTGMMAIFVVAGTVRAYKDAPKAEKIRKEAAKELQELIRKQKAGEINEQEATEQLKEIRRERNVGMAKSCAVSGALVLSGIGFGILSDVILRNWLHKTTVACAGLAASFAAYRSNVVADAGEEKDREYRLGLKREKKTVVDEKGKETEKEVLVKPVQQYDYTIFFDSSDYGIDPYDNDYNLAHFMTVQKMLDDIAHEKGFLYLNDVAAVFHKPLTEAGTIVGWIFRKGDEDKHIDLRVKDFMNEYNKGFVDELMYSMDPNVDGPITAECVRLGMMAP